MRRSVRAAFVAVVAVAAALLVVPGTAQAAPDLGPVLPSVPGSTSGGGAGDAALNTLVATSCDGGTPLTAPAWFQLPGGATGSVFARTRIQLPSTGSTTLVDSAKVAIVDVTASTVLSCDGSPAVLVAGHTNALVVRVDAADWELAKASCFQDDCPGPAEVFVDRGVSAPGNDDVANATVVSKLPYSTTGSTALATDDGPGGYSRCDWLGSIEEPVGTAWWSWTATADGYLTAAATGSGWTPCTAVVDTDPAAPGPEWDWWFTDEGQARPQFPVVAGHTYLVRVALEYDNSSFTRPLQTGGPFSLSLSFQAGPGPARQARITASGADAAALTWQPPVRNATSAPVTGYDVTFARVETGAATVTRSVGPGQLSTTFDGLALGYYVATITPRSAAGAAVPLTVHGGLIAPPGPPALLVRSDSPGEVTASWLEPVPAPFTEAPDSYRVTLLDTAPGSSPVVRTVSIFAALATTFTGLVSGHSYDVTVVGVSNGGGDGTPSTRRITLESAGGTGSLATAPTTVVRRGDRSVTAIWTPPTYTGTSGITAYRVRVFAGTSRTLVRSAVVGASRRSAILGGLVNGRSYTVDVAAVNASGPGAVRRSNLVTPATRPGAPVLGRAASGVPGGSTTASVTWSAPRATGGLAVRGYVVTAWRYDRSGHLVSTRTSSLRPTAARSLVWSLPLGWYRFSVRAVNAVGAGASTGRSALVVSR